MTIRELRKKLDEIVAKFGVNSKEAYKVSLEMDQVINEYMNTVGMKEQYQKSKEEMKRFEEEKDRKPTIKEWNAIAKEKGLLSHVSIGYIERNLKAKQKEKKKDY